MSDPVARLMHGVHPAFVLATTARPSAVIDAPSNPDVATPAREFAAAQYIRMSTDHQECSPQVQTERIAEYARKHALTIVKTYADLGRSGLSLDGRESLAMLINDVCSGQANFGVVLVYDVSRWGRFQDSDESAFYEFMCRRAGIRVVYCAEAFADDPSPMATIVKGLKRIMAAEYSRELSDKVSAAKRKLAGMGFCQGARPGLGLRRMVISADGEPRGVLEEGDRKFLHTDRVILVPGPKSEIKVVRWMFQQIASRKHSLHTLADELNRRGIKPVHGTRGYWVDDRLRHMLTNERYIGNLVFNRTSTKLRTRRSHVPKEQWVRCDGAFEPIVDPKLFWKAQEALQDTTLFLTREGALRKLRVLLDKHGKLTSQIINDAPNMPCAKYYDAHFGGLAAAYAAIGYVSNRDLRFVKGYGKRLTLIRQIRLDTVLQLRARGVSVSQQTLSTLLVNGRTRVAVMMCNCRQRPRTVQWTVQIHQKPRPEWLLAVRIDPETTLPMDFWLVRGGGDIVLIAARHRRNHERHRFDDLASALDKLCIRDVELNVLQPLPPPACTRTSMNAHQLKRS